MHMTNRSKNALNLFIAVVFTLTVFVSGCATTAKLPSGNQDKEHSIVLSEGDTIKVAFPSSPNLDTVAQIRRDGKITLPLVGEIEAVGMTATELENKLKDKYKDQLTS